MSEVGTNYLQEALEHAKRFITQEAETEITGMLLQEQKTAIIRLANGLSSIAYRDLWAEMRSPCVTDADMHNTATQIALYAAALVYELDKPSGAQAGGVEQEHQSKLEQPRPNNQKEVADLLSKQLMNLLALS
jgi:hypothetical protein